MLLSILYLLVFCWLIYHCKTFQFKILAPGWSVFAFGWKMMASLFVWAVYTFYYTNTKQNDIHKFFADATALHQTAARNPKAYRDLLFKGFTSETQQLPELRHWERHFDQAPVNENRLVIRINALLMWVTGGAYFVHVIIFCFIAYWASVWLFEAMFANAPPRVAFLGLVSVFFPSVLLWTSGVLKEPLMLLGLAFVLHGLIKPNSWTLRVLLFVIGAMLLLYTKFVVLLAVLPAVLIYTLAMQMTSLKKTIRLYIFALFTLVFVATLLPHLHTSLDWPKVLANKQNHALKEATYFKAGSAIDLEPIAPTSVSVLMAVPRSVHNVLLRPYVWEANNPLMLASALENLLLLLLMTWCLIRWRSLQSMEMNLVLFLLTCSFMYFAVVGIITPVLGNLVRYKAPLLPLLLAAIIMCSKGIDSKHIPKVLLR